MSDAVHFSLQGTVARIILDYPPVNVTAQIVRAGLMEALDRAEASRASRVVLTGAGRVFIAGADAKEFSAPPRAPHLPDVVARIADFPIPVIAAINGAALGGGLELALACAGRVCTPQATLGLPEVTLGIVPGAGGTQLLPRLIGLAPALGLIGEGRVIGAAKALELGLVDAISEDPVLAAQTLASRPAASALPPPAPDAAAMVAARAKAAKRSPQQVAPARAINLVEASSYLPLAEGLALERETFLELKTSDQAAALRHVFFAERAAMSRGRSGGADVQSAIVVGGGNMGAAIAYALAGAGIHITLIEADAAGLERARANVFRLYADAVKRGKMTEQMAQERQAASFSFHEGYEGLLPADLAIEAVFEDLDLKRRVFAALDAALPETTLLATNTSYLDPNRIAEGLRRPERFLGLHFFSPAHVMKLVEVIRTNNTSAETLATALRLTRRLKKISVLAGVCDGFIGNRILTRYRQICDVMLIEGGLPAQIDTAMRGFGMAMGPYEVQDLSGLDIAYANRNRMGWKHNPAFRYIPIADRLVEEGRLGRKSGAGWYDHVEGRQIPSARVDSIVMEESARAGITRRDVTDDEIVARATMAMVDEGLRILDEGVAADARDIDLVEVHGYGFPRWRGGPMHHADRLGLPEVLRRIETYAGEDPLSWSVPAILPHLVSSGTPLTAL
ncbi:MAG: 3-hydroxyacyl-CoA dehydrogenase NAD-binding domain-containing protein [Xanthobacter sp.]